MGRLIFILSMIFLGIQAVGQTNGRSLRYFNKTEAGFAFGVGHFKTDINEGIQKEIKNDQMIISIQNINGFCYQERVAIGLGVGAEFWQKGLFFPVFGQISYYLKPRDNTFFGTVNLGYSFGSREETNFYNEGTGGFMANVGIGYKMRVAKHIQFNYEIFYKYQAIQSTYTNHYNDSTSRIMDYKVPLHFLGFRIGITVP